MKRVLYLILLTPLLMLTATTALAALPENYVVYHGDRNVKKVAITVDDCYKPEYIKKIHELSKEYDFPITWFVVGVCLRDGEEDVWHDIIAHGSEIGNHSWRHPNLLDYKIGNVHTNVRKPQERIDEYLGYHYPLRLLRPPGGNYRNAERDCRPIFLQYGVEKVVLWDVSQTDPYKAFDDVQNGSILLYHTNEKDYECLKILVPKLLAEGYQLVTVSELLGLEPLELPVPTATPRPAETPAADLQPTESPVVAATAAAPALTAAPTETPSPKIAAKATATPAATHKLTQDDVISHGDRTVNQIAITVEDCNDASILQQIHTLSVKEDIPITYFVIGNKFAHKDKALWEDIIAHGSELGNHTWKHSVLINYSLSNGEVQMRKTQEQVDEVLGYHYPLRLVRPPQGSYKTVGKNFLPIFQEYGIEKVILWDVEQTNADKALKETKNGSILLYRTKAKDYECLVELIPLLKNAGYELVTVSELLGLEPILLEQPADAATP